ncbi:MAG: thiol-disulfide isomerase [Anaerolineales bacterium]|nr:thiol-disulfide isomerase [Anaerolineales bacterium]
MTLPTKSRRAARKPKPEPQALDPTPSPPPAETYILRLYVAGMMPQSVLAVENIKKICEDNLHGRYTLEVVDLYQQPHLAAGEQIIAVPTLIKRLPPPLRRIIGNLSDSERVWSAWICDQNKLSGSKFASSGGSHAAATQA